MVLLAEKSGTKKKPPAGTLPVGRLWFAGAGRVIFRHALADTKTKKAFHKYRQRTMAVK
jgi:hypothetical protein